MRSSVNLAPWLKIFFVTGSRSEPNCENDNISWYCAKSNFKVEDTLFIAFVCALEPTRDTDRPESTAGLMPAANRSVCKKICPSVIEITLVGIYAEISPACVSIIGSAVNDPPPKASDNFAALSSNLLCK